MVLKVKLALSDQYQPVNCRLIQIFVAVNICQFCSMFCMVRDYARGRCERPNRFTPADVAFFTSESDKNVALIFRKVRYLPISNIRMCHQPKFDLGRSSTHYLSGLHKKIDTW